MHLQRIAAATLLLVAATGDSQAVTTYTPEQAISVLYSSLRSSLGFTPDTSGSQWLSLSMVGSLVTAGDTSQVNDLANFCPDPSPVVRVYNRIRKLDRIYRKLIDGSVGPFIAESQSFKDATAVIMDPNGAETQEYKKYLKFEEDYSTAYSAYLLSKDPAERSKQNHIIEQIDEKWPVFGYQGKIENALNAIRTDNPYANAVLQKRRSDVLNNYLRAGLKPSDFPGAFKSPASELSPSVDLWPQEDGWAGFSYSSDETSNRYSASESSSSGFGGLNLGFITLVGSGGGTGSSESKVTETSKFSYSFQLKRITIRRPWLDTEIFFEPARWTWKKVANTKGFPLVAIERKDGEPPRQPPKFVYDNANVDCALMPLELVIARKRSLIATVTKDDYQKVVESGKASGGGGLFGIFGGGGSNSWSTTKISEDQNNMTFSVDAPGIAVIGLISEVVPQLPAPNENEQWPPNAWLRQ